MKIDTQKGSTLIELIVSIAVFGIIMVPVLGIFAASTMNNMYSKIEATNGAIAQSAMEYYKKTAITGPSTLYIFLTKANIKNGYTENYGIPLKPEFSFNCDDSQNPDKNSFSYVNSLLPVGEVYDYAVRVSFLTDNTNTPVMTSINVTVWDLIGKEKKKINFASLRQD